MHRGWLALERCGERLALVQPLEGAASIVFYLSQHPWQQRREAAGSPRQGVRFAERWLASRIREATNYESALAPLEMRQ